MGNFIELVGSHTTLNITYIVSVTEETIYDRPDLRGNVNKPQDKTYDYFNETMNIGSTEKEEVTNQRKQILITMVTGVKYISYESKDDFMSRVNKIFNSVCCVSCN